MNREEKKITVLAALVLLAVAFVVSAGRDKRATHGGTGGGGGPRFLGAESESEAKFDERTHPIQQVVIAVPDCPDCELDLSPADPEAEKRDMGLNGRLYFESFNLSKNTLTVRVYAGGPVLTDPKAPDPAVRKTYLPEKPQDIPLNEECTFWFSPYLQLNVTFQERPAKGRPSRILMTGWWYRKTYARQ